MISFALFTSRMITKHSDVSSKTKGQLWRVICWAEDNTLPVSRQSQTPVTQKVRRVDISGESVASIFFSFRRTAFDGDDPNRALTRSIRREVTKLTEQWSHLINRSDSWKHRLDEYMTVSIEICISWFRISRQKRNFNWNFAHTPPRLPHSENFSRFHFRRNVNLISKPLARLDNIWRWWMAGGIQTLAAPRDDNPEKLLRREVGGGAKTMKRSAEILIKLMIHASSWSGWWKMLSGIILKPPNAF